MATTITIGPYSAYAIAVKYGYTGTEEEWINSVETARKSAEEDAEQAHTDMLAANETLTVIRNLQNDWLLAAYPVGSLYLSADPTSPAELFGGTWEQIAADRALMGASSSHSAGSTAEAGLPNVSGSLSDFAGGNVTMSGALSIGSVSSVTQGYRTADTVNWSWKYAKNCTFNASRSNAIYGKSTTVQPPAYYTYIWRRIA